jgi:hypothetical protein
LLRLMRRLPLYPSELRARQFLVYTGHAEFALP